MSDYILSRFVSIVVLRPLRLPVVTTGKSKPCSLPLIAHYKLEFHGKVIGRGALSVVASTSAAGSGPLCSWRMK